MSATRCPVRAQNDAIVPAEPLGPTRFGERLLERGRDFEAEIFSELIALHGDAIVVAEQAEDAQGATLEAMRRGAPLILAGRLPSDYAGRRVGRPDVLVAAPGGGYRAVDVKCHMAVVPEPPGGHGMPALLSPLAAPALETAVLDGASSAKKNQADALQLAHYQRMLEAAGLSASDGCWGGVIGTEREVVWYDLCLAVWRTRSVSRTSKARSTMECYEFEFDFRLDIIAVAEEHRRDPSVPLLVVPVRITECDRCPWWDYCRSRLETPPGDVSLLPNVGWPEWRVHQDHGVTNRAQLAALDPRTARLVAKGVDVTALRAAAQVLGSDFDISDIETAGIRPKDVAALAAEGITSVRDVGQLCGRTSSYSDVGLGGLATQIDLARAALGPEPVHRRRGVDSSRSPALTSRSTSTWRTPTTAATCGGAT